MAKKYTKEFLISELHRFVEIYHRVPSVYLLEHTEGFPSRSGYLRYFGSYNNAIIAARLDINQDSNLYTKDGVITLLQQFYNKNGYIPTSDCISNNGDLPSEHILRNLFGTFNKALEAAEIPITKIHTKKLTGNETCSICCATSSNNSWRFYNNQRICSLCFNKTPEEKERHSIRRRDLGMKPINAYFEGSHFHHLHLGNDHAIGLYIPADLHRSIFHSSKTGIGMDEINKLAIAWFWEQIKNERIE